MLGDGVGAPNGFSGELCANGKQVSMVVIDQLCLFG
jgi:hypothetical protein